MNDLSIIDTFLQTFGQYIDSGFGLLSGDVAFWCFGRLISCEQYRQFFPCA